MSRTLGVWPQDIFVDSSREHGAVGQWLLSSGGLGAQQGRARGHPGIRARGPLGGGMGGGQHCPSVTQPLLSPSSFSPSSPPCCTSSTPSASTTTEGPGALPCTKCSLNPGSSAPQGLLGIRHLPDKPIKRSWNSPSSQTAMNSLSTRPLGHFNSF